MSLDWGVSIEESLLTSFVEESRMGSFNWGVSLLSLDRQVSIDESIDESQLLGLDC